MTTVYKRVMLGDSNNGYDTALVTGEAGKYRLVPGSINGRAWHIRRAIAALNRDRSGYTTRAGDEKSVYCAQATARELYNGGVR